MCWAVGSKSVGLSWADADCVLLAPQSASELSKIEEMVHGVIPCALINDGDFASMNGDAVLNQALDLIKNKHPKRCFFFAIIKFRRNQNG